MVLLNMRFSVRVYISGKCKWICLYILGIYRIANAKARIRDHSLEICRIIQVQLMYLVASDSS